jgi:MinD-like ATPase involved in chromosome partitioning or flagellar assembly
VNVLAEIAAGSSGGDLRAGALRRQDLEALGRILDEPGRGALLVTGAGDGPLALSTGLAAAAAARGTRTVLLECGLGAPALADALGLEPVPGLNEYLREEAEAREILQPLVLAGPASAEATGPLICIVAGEPDAAGQVPVEYDGLRHVLAKLRHAYELVVLHGPPLGDESGALREAAAGADAALACVGPALASGRAGRKLRKALNRLPAPAAGVVVYGRAGQAAS